MFFIMSLSVLGLEGFYSNFCVVRFVYGVLIDVGWFINNIFVINNYIFCMNVNYELFMFLGLVLCNISSEVVLRKVLKCFR